MNNKSNKRLLIGRGERLTEEIKSPVRGFDKTPLYSIEESLNRLTPMLEKATSEITKLPALACPKNQSVFSFVLNPSFIAKSYFPNALFAKYNMRPIGSRMIPITPIKWTRKREPERTPTLEIFVSSDIDQFRTFSSSIISNTFIPEIEGDLNKIEQIFLPTPHQKLKYIPEGSRLFEIVLHYSEQNSPSFILSGFKDYLESINVKASLQDRIEAGGLCFVPIRTVPERVETIALFSFLRLARVAPKLRPIEPNYSTLKRSVFQVKLPKTTTIDDKVKVAIFDGGLPDKHPLGPWVKELEPAGIGAKELSATSHGLSVTSALLFGPLQDGIEPLSPTFHVDHWRVLDKKSDGDDAGLKIIERIKSVLDDNEYHFINLSLGPDLPIEDNDVNPWTAVLDQYLADGTTLACFAVGNGGERDHTSGNNRIQPPADCVNGVGVGACDSRFETWDKALYSSVGPGRSPGLIKPDIVAFGGSNHEVFWTCTSGESGRSTQGTSFSAPNALRTAIGIRTFYGDAVKPLTSRALLIHKSEARATQPDDEVGFGRVSENVGDYIYCTDTEVTILYQGKLDPGKYRQFQIPVPENEMVGMVSISATICYTTDTDVEDPFNYTRSGLEVVFRPDSRESKKTKTFFGEFDFADELDLRIQAHKWETVRKNTIKMRGSSLHDPVFDVHYMARQHGRNASRALRIPYSCVITISAPKMPRLYDEILNRYSDLPPLFVPVSMSHWSHSCVA